MSDDRSALDRVLDTIDVGLQSVVPDPTFGEVSPANNGACVRCGGELVEGSEFCAGCRSFLLGDEDVDPADRIGWTDWGTTARIFAAPRGSIRFIEPPDLSEEDMARARRRFYESGVTVCGDGFLPPEGHSPVYGHEWESEGPPVGDERTEWGVVPPGTVSFALLNFPCRLPEDVEVDDDSPEV